MVELFEASVIKYLKDTFLEKFGINISFKYSPEMDFIEEFRKDRFSKINDSTTTDIMKQILGEDVHDINMAIWKRTPIKKFKNSEDGISPFKINPYDQLAIETENGIELRDVFYGKTDFSIKFFSSEMKIINLVELMYNTYFYDVNPPIKITFSINSEPLELDYQTYFNEIDSIDYINLSSYGSMNLIEFTFSVYGIFFSPYYYLENLNTIKEIDLRVFAFNKKINLDILNNYNLNNIDLEHLICSETCQVNNETHLIEDDTCKSLNN